MFDTKSKSGILAWSQTFTAISLLVFFAAFSPSALAQSGATPDTGYHEDAVFIYPRGFEGRVEFWRLIFTRYGKYERVFHHREHPQIIYSVLDFSEIEEKYSGNASLRRRENAVEAEISRIQKALKNLAAGKNPKGAFENRIKTLFSRFHKTSASAYREAANKKKIRYQRGIKERFREGLVRAGRYLYAIEQIFAAEGVPLGLARLPLVESSFDYQAYSSVGAAGIWQFMPATGRIYMTVNSSIDNRRDPIIASRAAAKYLKSAKKRLGKWPLAVTSYNHGVAGVARAVKKTGTEDLSVIVEKYEGKSFGFASSNFYAEFLAALDVERNSERYFPGLKRDDPELFDEIKLSKSLTFSQLASLSKTPKSTLEKLNLAFKRPVLRNQRHIPRGQLVKVPVGKGAVLAAAVPKSSMLALGKAVKKLPRSTDSDFSGFYVVKRGDTLSTIASRFDISQNALKRSNGIRNSRLIRIGQKLKVPQSAAGAAGSSRQAAREHLVTRGENLGALASKYGTSIASLRKANGLGGSNTIRIGQTLKIPGKGSSGRKAVSGGKKLHTVRSGDSLYAIARKYSVSVADLVSMNPRDLSGGKRSRIYPGQKLLVRK